MLTFLLAVTIISTDPLQSIPTFKATTGNVSINLRHQLLLNPHTLTLTQSFHNQNLKINKANVARSMSPFLLLSRKNFNLKMFNSRFDKFTAPIIASADDVYNYVGHANNNRVQIYKQYNKNPYDLVYVSNCSFSNGAPGSDQKGGGLYITQAKEIIIEYSNFTSNRDSAIYIEPGNNQQPGVLSVKLLYCKFEKNSGTQGSSINIKKVSKASITRCLFLGDSLTASGNSILSRISLESVFSSTIKECAFNELTSGNLNYGYDVAYTAKNQYAPSNVEHYLTDNCFSTNPNAIAGNAYIDETYNGKSSSLSIQSCVTELPESKLFKKVNGGVYPQGVEYNHSNEDGWCVVPTDPIPEESSSEEETSSAEESSSSSASSSSASSFSSSPEVSSETSSSSELSSSEETSDEESSSTDKQETGVVNTTAIVVGSVIGVIVLVVIIVLLIIFCRTDNRKAFQNDIEEDANVDGYNVPI